MKNENQMIARINKRREETERESIQVEYKKFKK